jgi:hypothetical protein
MKFTPDEARQRIEAHLTATGRDVDEYDTYRASEALVDAWGHVALDGLEANDLDPVIEQHIFW